MATVRATFAQPVLAPLNDQQLSVHKHISQFLSGAGIGCLNAGTDNIHRFAAFLLRHVFKIYETETFIFINGQNNRRSRRAFPQGSKPRLFWKTADFSAFFGSWHRYPCILPDKSLFPALVQRHSRPPHQQCGMRMAGGAACVPRAALCRYGETSRASIRASSFSRAFFLCSRHSLPSPQAQRAPGFRQCRPGPRSAPKHDRAPMRRNGPRCRLPAISASLCRAMRTSLLLTYAVNLS